MDAPLFSGTFTGLTGTAVATRAVVAELGGHSGHWLGVPGGHGVYLAQAGQAV